MLDCSPGSCIVKKAFWLNRWPWFGKRWMSLVFLKLWFWEQYQGQLEVSKWTSSQAPPRLPESATLCFNSPFRGSKCLLWFENHCPNLPLNCMYRKQSLSLDMKCLENDISAQTTFSIILHDSSFFHSFSVMFPCLYGKDTGCIHYFSRTNGKRKESLLS